MTPDQLDAVFKALADPTRRRILDRLAVRPDQSLFELCAAAVAEGQAPMSRQAVSQHLDVLEKAGIVLVTWSGRTKLHRLETGPIRDAIDGWLGRHIGRD